MKATDKRLKAVDAEYAAALKEHQASRKRLAAAGEARVVAHRAVEWERSQAGKKALGMTDAEWEAHKQFIDAARGPKAEPVVSSPSAR